MILVGNLDARSLKIRNTGVILKNGSTTSYLRVLQGAVINTNGTTDHGSLVGLADDDHNQYFNQSRGDARYIKQSDYIDGGTFN